ncbi:MAG: 50S ribosomal protein L17 [Pseudomonadota bacterium]
MRHKMAFRKLGRKTAHRQAMFSNMLSSLIMHDQIKTTLPKAKDLKRLADKMVTLGKQGTLHARRRAISIVRDKTAVHKLFSETVARYGERNGGYTRIYKLGFRDGDAAPMALIEYIMEGEDVGSLTASHETKAHKAKKETHHAKSKVEKEVKKKTKAKKEPKKETKKKAKKTTEKKTAKKAKTAKKSKKKK